MANTATQLQLRRGTTAENDAFTGAQGELTYDSEENNIRIHDGQTAGGRRVPLGVSNFSALVPDYKNFQDISSGSNAPGPGFVCFIFGVIQNGYLSGYIDGVEVCKIGSSACQQGLRSGCFPVDSNNVLTISSGSIRFFPLKS